MECMCASCLKCAQLWSVDGLHARPGDMKDITRLGQGICGHKSHMCNCFLGGQTLLMLSQGTWACARKRHHGRSLVIIGGLSLEMYRG